MKNTMKFLQWTAVAVAMTCCLAAKAEDDPNALLKSKGLELDGSTWVLPLEEDLNREMAKLRQLSGEARKAQNETRKFDQMIRKVKGQIGAWKQQHERLVKETRKAMTDNKYNRIVEEINKLEAQINAAEAEGNKRQGELDAELTEALGAYSMEMMNFYDKAEASVKQYAELAKDEEVQAAIKASSEAEGRTITLGPSSNFERQWKTLSRMREELKAGEIPLEKDGNSLWVGVKINGQPIRQMVLDTGCSDISLPFDFARQLGITITPEMPTVQCSLADAGRATSIDTPTRAGAAAAWSPRRSGTWQTY